MRALACAVRLLCVPGGALRHKWRRGPLISAVQICNPGCKPGARSGARWPEAPATGSGCVLPRCAADRLAQGRLGSPWALHCVAPWSAPVGPPFLRTPHRGGAGAGGGRSVSVGLSALGCGGVQWGAVLGPRRKRHWAALTPPALGAVIGSPAAPLGAPVGPGVSPSCGPLLRPAALLPRLSVPRPTSARAAFAAAASVVVGFSPASPRPAAPAGGSRERVASGPRHSPSYFLTRPLTASNICAIMLLRGPFRSFLGLPSPGVSMDGKRPLDRKAGRFFYARAFPFCPGFFAAQIQGRSTAKPGPRSAFFPRVNNPKIVNH